VSNARSEVTGGLGGGHRTRGFNPWYATGIAFQVALERDLDAHPEHRGLVTSSLTWPSLEQPAGRLLIYQHAGLDVPGREDAVPVSIEFHESPTYDTYRLDPADYPRVLADLGAASPHRLPGDALCLWYPRDADDRRWTHTVGLIALLNLARNHLLYEGHWRATGGFGPPAGEWLGDEAPHGFPDGAPT